MKLLIGEMYVIEEITDEFETNDKSTKEDIIGGTYVLDHIVKSKSYGANPTTGELITFDDELTLMFEMSGQQVIVDYKDVKIRESESLIRVGSFNEAFHLTNVY